MDLQELHFRAHSRPSKATLLTSLLTMRTINRAAPVIQQHCRPARGAACQRDQTAAAQHAGAMQGR
eukprot:12065117-Prorocentrum_lima.AAC.1